MDQGEAHTRHVVRDVADRDIGRARLQRRRDALAADAAQLGGPEMPAG